MNIEWLGGTQSPLGCGFLRAALVRAQCPSEDVVRFDVHDVDSVGAEGGDDSSFWFADDAGSTWRPLKLDVLFSGKMQRRVLCGHSPAAKRLTIAGLRMGEGVCGTALAEELRWQAEKLRRHLNGNQFDLAAIQQRGDELAALVSQAETGSSWSEVMRSLAMYMFGPLLAGVEVSSTTAYWSLTSYHEYPERFSMLQRFLSDQQLRESYPACLNRSRPDFPYFVLARSSAGIVRLPLTLDSAGVLCIDDLKLGHISEIASVQLFIDALRSKNVEAVAVAPKAVPLYAQLRCCSRLFGKEPPYLASGQRLLRLIDMPTSPRYEVHFDLAKALGRTRWRSGLTMLHQTKGCMRGDKATRHWQQHPTSLGVWLIGGREALMSCVQSGHLAMRKD